MREASHKLDNWPEHLRYVFDCGDARASRVVIISPFDFHAARTMDVTFVKRDKLRVQEGTLTERRVKSKTKKRGDHPKEEPIFKTKWKGRFGAVICDEGHRIRHFTQKSTRA